MAWCRRATSNSDGADCASLTAQACNKLLKPGPSFAALAFGDQYGLHPIHRLIKRTVDDTVVIINEMAHLVVRFGHAGSHDVVRVLGAAA